MYKIQKVKCCYTCKYFKEAKMKRGSSHGHSCEKEITFPIHIFGVCDEYTRKNGWQAFRRLILTEEEFI